MPICLPFGDQFKKSFVGSQPFVAGWGSTVEDDDLSPILQEVQFPILENRECVERYRAIGKLVDDAQFSTATICAGNLSGGKDACQGDSGGPLMMPINANNTYKFYVIGVVSYGIGCAHANIPGVYTNVPVYIKWIQDKINTNK